MPDLKLTQVQGLSTSPLFLLLFTPISLLFLLRTHRQQSKSSPSLPVAVLIATNDSRGKTPALVQSLKIPDATYK